MDEVQHFILENYPISGTWTPESLINWIGWSAHLGFLVKAYDDDSNIVGLAIARPMKAVDEYIQKGIEHDNGGDFIFVDLAVAPTKQILQALAFGILARCGNKKYVAFHKQGKLKVHRLETARRALLRR